MKSLDIVIRGEGLGLRVKNVQQNLQSYGEIIPNTCPYLSNPYP